MFAARDDLLHQLDRRQRLGIEVAGDVRPTVLEASRVGADPAQVGSDSAAKPAAVKDDSGQVTVSAQFKKEALESWKPKAEQYNKAEAELAAANARVQELERIAYGGGARQATDPRAELVAQLQAQAQYDPVAQATLLNMQETLEAKAEVWLAQQLQEVPKEKREQVAHLIRNAGYQMGAERALSLVTDPESKTLHDKLAEMQAELDRLKTSKPNGTSPGSVVPATAGQEDGGIQETIKASEYAATLKAGGDRARALKIAVGSGKTKLQEG